MNNFKKLCVSVTRRKALLKELNQTEESMDALFQDAVGFNALCKDFVNSGMDWRNMNESCMRSLVGLREKYDQRQAEERQRAEKEKKMKVEAERITALDTRSETQKLIDKITSGDKLYENELWEFTEYEIEREYGENRRWSRSVTSICKLTDDNGKDRYFQLDWEQGLTESQPDEYYEQPFEVTMKEYEKTVTVKEWIKERT